MKLITTTVEEENIIAFIIEELVPRINSNKLIIKHINKSGGVGIILFNLNANAPSGKHKLLLYHCAPNPCVLHIYIYISESENNNNIVFLHPNILYMIKVITKVAIMNLINHDAVIGIVRVIKSFILNCHEFMDVQINAPTVNANTKGIYSLLNLDKIYLYETVCFLSSE